MGDDLVDDWWVQEDVVDEEETERNEKDSLKKKKKKKVKETIQDGDDNATVKAETTKKTKKKKEKEADDRNENEEPQKRKKKKLKRKADEEAVFADVDLNAVAKKKKKKKISKIKEYETTCESLWNLFEEELQKTLSAIEIEDVKPDTNDWYLEESEKFPRDKLEQFSPYLMNVAAAWEKQCSLLTKKSIRGSPAMLILTSSAVRAVDLLRHASSFKGDHKSVKLFAKHFKVNEQVKLLNENVVHLAVGTPHRVSALIENGSLKIEELKYLIVDWSWKDVKMRQIYNMPNVKEEFIVLFQKHIFKLCQKGTLSVGLF